MSGASKELRQAVFNTLIDAKFALSLHKLVSEVDDIMSDGVLSEDVKTVSRAAYITAVHAWMAMIAMMGNSPDVAFNAAQSAAKARHIIVTLSQKTFLLDIPADGHELHEDRIPEERELIEMWNALQSSLPDAFSVPDSLGNPVIREDP